VEGDVNTLEAVRSTTAASSREAVVANADSSIRKGTVLVVDDGLLENINF
jgi:hypothetical protein